VEGPANQDWVGGHFAAAASLVGTPGNPLLEQPETAEGGTPGKKGRRLELNSEF